ncbi:MAG: radical SAM protein [Burkholderiales bacterium]|nr:radical SAM protein [Burkholderiales bacterium]
MPFERISIELTRLCNKGCRFCYNGSNRHGDTLWTVEEVIDFVNDCQKAGTRAVSFGGGEPLQYPGCFDVLHALKGKLFRSMTTNGLLLKGNALKALIAAEPDKVHVSLHFPDNQAEVRRVLQQVHMLAEYGVKSGVNLLVARSQLTEASAAAALLRDRGIGNDRIVYLPMRGNDTPSASEVARVAGNLPFQSMTCINHCHASPRFCSIGWDKRVAWCSYTTARRQLPSLTAEGLRQAMQGLGLEECRPQRPAIALNELTR